MALHVATLACERLDRTSALVVQLRKESEASGAEQGLLGRIFVVADGAGAEGADCGA